MKDARLRRSWLLLHRPPKVSHSLGGETINIQVSDSVLAGMFLYARVLLSGLDLLGDIREIRKEFEVLPATLHEAYVFHLLLLHSLLAQLTLSI